MGMADPRDWTYQMMCCGHGTRWLPPSERQRGSSNDRHDVDKCPNRYCPTNTKPRR